MIQKHLILFAITAFFGITSSCRKNDSEPQSDASHKAEATPPSIQQSSTLSKSKDPNEMLKPDSLPNDEKQLKSDYEVYHERGLAVEAAIVESLRKELFAVPLSKEASRERDLAWEELAVKPPAQLLNGEQCDYTRTLLDEKLAGTPIEKLVFWRLVAIRFGHQSPTGITIALGGSHVGVDEKLQALLYSALNEDPEKMPLQDAINLAKKRLKEAAGE